MRNQCSRMPKPHHARRAIKITYRPAVSIGVVRRLVATGIVVILIVVVFVASDTSRIQIAIADKRERRQRGKKESARAVGIFADIRELWFILPLSRQRRRAAHTGGYYTPLLFLHVGDLCVNGICSHNYPYRRCRDNANNALIRISIRANTYLSRINIFSFDIIF